jgi:uncharacterized ParB-like nuclease family protein
MVIGPQNPEWAAEDFRRARTRAVLEQISARLRGKSAELVCYDDVQEAVSADSRLTRGLQDIPIDAIVGSVGRCTDFTRTFLPLRDETEGRWTRVEQAAASPKGLPPIDVYKVGDVYFVLDGNHRVSVARQLGATYIEAYVTEFPTRVPLSPSDRPDELIVKIEYAEFLERTRLDELRPDADLSASVPGQYREMEEHITVHRYFMGIEQKREISYEEAAAHWYDVVYLPVAQVIREQALLRDFPGRTEADLYLWLLNHRAELGQEMEMEVGVAEAADDLVRRFSPKLQHTLARVLEKIRGTLVPTGIARGVDSVRRDAGQPEGSA